MIFVRLCKLKGAKWMDLATLTNGATAARIAAAI